MEFKKNKAIYKYIYCDVWKCGISVFIGDNESLLKWAKKFYTDSEEQDMIMSIEKHGSENEYREKRVAGRIYESDSGQWIIHLPSFSFSYDPVEISNMSHEILHAAFLILDFVGMEYMYQGNNEAYTYLQEFLLKNALNKEGYKGIK